MVKPPSKDQNSWLITFEWPKQFEGQVLLDAALEKTLVNVQNEASTDLINLAVTIDRRNANRAQNFRNKLDVSVRAQDNRNRRKLQFLAEQSKMAKASGIELNLFGNFGLLENSDNAIALKSAKSENFYLRGYKAIYEEISITKERTAEEKLLETPSYVEILEKIDVIENDLTSTQLRS